MRHGKGCPATVRRTPIKAKEEFYCSRADWRNVTDENFERHGCGSISNRVETL